jgi:hypothetical protein
MNHETTRVLPTLSAFLLGLGLGVGGTWLALPRQAPADAVGTSVPQVERDSTTSAPPQAVTLLERTDGSERGSAAPLVQAAPRPGAVAGAEPEAEGGDAGENDRLKAFRRSILDTSTGGRCQYLTLLQDLTTEDAPGIMALFREMAQRGHAVGDYDRLFWLRWAEVDGAAASAAMFSRDKRFPETSLSNLAISTWAKYEPEAASAWLFAQEEIPLREGMTNGLLEGMDEYDPAFAMRFLESANFSTRQRAQGRTGPTPPKTLRDLRADLCQTVQIDGTFTHHPGQCRLISPVPRWASRWDANGRDCFGDFRNRGEARGEVITDYRLPITD